VALRPAEPLQEPLASGRVGTVHTGIIAGDAVTEPAIRGAAP
jgi:hypothetical protein